MSSDRRFEQELPALLGDLYLGPMPTYRDRLLQQTARTRQRPAWSFLERWLPMVDAVRQPYVVPRIPLRTIGLGLALIGLFVAAMALVVVGTRARLPEPFGLARSGLVAYAADGDIFTVDPVTGVSTPIITGPEVDLEPRYSRDGTHLVFEPKAEGSSGPGRLYVAASDGGGMTLVTPGAPSEIDGYQFSPDGSEILFTSLVDGLSTISLADSDGSGVRTLDVGMAASDATYRPPDGAEILFASGEVGLYAVNPESGPVRPIVAPSAGQYRSFAQWSPDGTRVAYSEWTDASTWTVRVRVIAADGTGDRLLAKPPDAVWESVLGWSNDGTRLVVVRGNTGSERSGRAVIVPVDGSGVGVEIENSGLINPGSCSSWEWAPDDSMILAIPPNVDASPLILDPVTGTARSAGWTTTSCPTWQRLSP